MLNLKTLVIFASVLAALAVSVTPAMAEFESQATPKQSQGKVNILKEGKFQINGLFPVTCPKAEIKAIYRIQVKGQIKQQQASTTRGPHLEFQVKSWGSNCITTVGKEKIPTTVEPCNLQLEQRSKTEAAAAVVTGCVIKIPNCTLQIPQGMETAANSGQGINVGQKTVALESIGPNGIAKANVTGGGQGQLGGKIFANQTGSGCPVLGTTEKGELLEFEAEAENVNAT